MSARWPLSLTLGAAAAAGFWVLPRLTGLLPTAAARGPGPASAAVEKRPVRLVAVGDLMLGTSVKRLMARFGPRYPFRRYRELLGGADLAFGNLETPLSDRGEPTPGKSPESLRNRTNFLFRAPPAAAEGLAWAGFDVLSVANNHTMDYGPTALRDTLAALRESGLAAAGAGENLDRAVAPVYLERQGQRVALFAISDVLPRFSVAGEHAPGQAPARGAWFERVMPAAVAAARREADWVLVSVHWGREGFTGATPRQRRLGRRLIDWGADVVIGHHTHCLGPIERYRGGLIHYSLGNFVSAAGSRGPVEAWEVVLPPPGERPTETSHAFRWDGTRLRVASRLRPDPGEGVTVEASAAR